MARINIKTTQKIKHASALPSAVSPVDYIIGMASLVGWYQAADPFVDVINGTEIDAFRDRAGGSVVFNRYSATNRADLVATTSMNGLTAAKFNGTTTADGSTDYYVLSDSALPDVGGAFTYALAITPADNSGADYIFGRFQGSTQRAIISIAPGSDNIRFQVGSKVIEAPVVIGSANVVFASWDGDTLRMRVNGTDATPVDGTGEDVGTGPLFLGTFSVSGSQAFDGWVADAIVWEADLLGTNDAAIPNFESFCAANYGT